MCVLVAQAGEFDWNCNWTRRGQEAFNQAQPPMQQPQIIAWSMELLGIGCVCVLLLGACGREAPAARDLIGREICKRCVINSCVANYKGRGR